MSALESPDPLHAELLMDLEPEWISRLPPEVVIGRLLIYKREKTNRFALYSVGWNEKDDGGLPGDGHDDWIWPSVAK